MENTRQGMELAQVLANHGEEFLSKNQLCPEQIKAFNAIITCRTSVLGGHASICDTCGHTQQAYNSCRNRHCPKCQFIKQVQWIDRLKASLPPIKYFHLVFTIPQCLHKTLYINQSSGYSILFKSAWEALKQCLANPKYLGAQTGAVAVLHTWGQTLTYHPHIHMIVPAGGLSSDEMEWVRSNQKYLLPVKILSGVFRAVFSRLLQQAISKQQIKLPDDLEDFDQLKTKMYAKNWVVFAEKPLAGPQRVVKYLGRYTNRVAFTNSRLVADEGGKISFSYKDYSMGGVIRSMSLDASEFIKRFFRHVLPCGFYKIRYFGIMAQCNMTTKLALCFELLEKAAYYPQLQGLPAIEVLQMVTGIDPFVCPHCKKGRMQAISLWMDKHAEPG
ncbi:MAG: IS91 family transposase [Bacteroidales bacterium]|jgi:hypothetical protein|nr:IS91 family transposase [Bacteroidales bacterium]MDY0335158.1 IS91 family transposase [Bacteroidales bacterium]NCB85731.1 IS91 family transposase [Bacteroidia bacterium]